MGKTLDRHVKRAPSFHVAFAACLRSTRSIRRNLLLGWSLRIVGERNGIMVRKRLAFAGQSKTLLSWSSACDSRRDEVV